MPNDSLCLKGVYLLPEQWETVCLALQERVLDKFRSAELTKGSSPAAKAQFEMDCDLAGNICNKIAAQAGLDEMFRAGEKRTKDHGVH